MEQVKNFSIATLRGVGQIMLQENALTGILFLIGIFIGSIQMGIAATLATVVGTATAMILKFDKQNIEQGLYGFSAALVGVALLLFFKSNILVWLAVIISSALATILQNFFIKKNLPVFTFPFVFVTWVIIYLLNNFLPSLLTQNTDVILNKSDILFYPLRGVGQVIFQSNWIVGLIFLIGIAINSAIAAVLVIVASIIGGLFAFTLGTPIDSIAMGLLSYNAVLTTIVFKSIKAKELVLNLFAVILTVAISLLMAKFNLVQLTFPFVLASFSVIMVQRLIKREA